MRLRQRDHLVGSYLDWRHGMGIKEERKQFDNYLVGKIGKWADLVCW